MFALFGLAFQRRFLGFVLLTMFASAVLGAIFCGVWGALFSNDPALVFVVPIMICASAGFFIPIYFVLWILPSALIVRVLFSQSKGWLGARRARALALMANAAIASVAVVVIYEWFLSYGWTVGPGEVLLLGMFLTGPIAVVISPFMAARLGLELEG